MAKNRANRVRTPTVLQMEAVECGAASLSMVLSYYGRHIPLAELRKQCGVSRDGSKAANILKAARHYGCKAKGLTRSFEKLKQTQLPVILFWNFNHFVTLEGIEENEVRINDPGVGHRRISISEFKKAFTGVTLAIEPDEGFVQAGRRPSAWSTLFDSLRGYRSAVGYIFIASLLMILPALVLPAATQVFIDSVLLDNRTDWYRPLITFLLSLCFLQLTVDGLRSWATKRFHLTQMIEMNSKFIWKLLRLPIGFYTQRYPGEIVDRAKLNDSVAEIVAGPLCETLANCLTMLVIGSVLCFYDPWLAFLGIGLSVFNFFALSKLTASREEANISASLEMGKMQGCVIAGLQSMETIKASGQEITFFTKFAGYMAKGMNATQRLQSSSVMLGVLPEFSKQFTSLAILLFGGMKVISGQFTIGMLVAFHTMMLQFLKPLQEIFDFSIKTQELTGSITRIQDVMDNHSEDDPPAEMPKNTSGRSIVRLPGTLQLKDVSFAFNNSLPPLIENFSMDIPAGKSLAFVGGSGSGKSTIAKIICGLYAPTQGEVLINDYRICDISRPVFRNTVGFVEQESGIFEGTIRENLTLLDHTVPEEDIIKAAKDAQIHEVVQNMTKGYDTILLENGVNLSGGQRQRLEIARALINNPSILIMDEATSALDAETEHQVMLNVRRRGCTCVIVAHRLSTIRDCDEIVVLANGVVKERGKHEQMISNDGPYSQLIKQHMEDGS